MPGEYSNAPIGNSGGGNQGAGGANAGKSGVGDQDSGGAGNPGDPGGKGDGKDSKHGVHVQGPPKRKADDVGNSQPKRHHHNPQLPQGSSLSALGSQMISAAHATNMVAQPPLQGIDPAQLEPGVNGPVGGHDSANRNFTTSFQMTNGDNIHAYRGHNLSIINDISSIASRFINGPAAEYWIILGESILPEDESRRRSRRYAPSRGETSRGDVPGCPRCNTMQHSWDECPKRPDESQAEVRDQDTFNHLVRSRGSLPPIRTEVPWPSLLARLSRESRSGYPATKAYVQQQFRQDEEQFRTYLSDPTYALFLKDPATISTDAIHKNLTDLVESEVYRPPPKRMADDGDNTTDRSDEAADDGDDNKGDEVSIDMHMADSSMSNAIVANAAAVAESAAVFENAAATNNTATKVDGVSMDEAKGYGTDMEDFAAGYSD
ncbi:hypothetical protein F5144DRAFT_610615 [Chaetomium tenue]|uniref:Uncharacterized protein n=1 Tax=Chaetomium tenue TaxID=1854479 RepID=A0ACB7PA60_9PEZI|nr:hypothetical protein F5144DRAFT_610615 [Chaetomium globosum]